MNPITSTLAQSSASDVASRRKSTTPSGPGVSGVGAYGGIIVLIASLRSSWSPCRGNVISPVLWAKTAFRNINLKLMQP